MNHGLELENTFVSFRVTQLYETGAAVYIYFGFNHQGIPNGMEIYEEIEVNARNSIMEAGGSISHHHGIGKIRKRFLEKTINQTGINILKEIKGAIDPDNIFGVNNTLYKDEEERKKDVTSEGKTKHLAE